MNRRAIPVNGAWLDVKAAAAYLGGLERWLRRLVADSRVPYRKLGRQVVFRRKNLEECFDDLPGVIPRQVRFKAKKQPRQDVTPTRHRKDTNDDGKTTPIRSERKPNLW